MTAGVAQLVEHKTSKYKALRPIPSTAKIWYYLTQTCNSSPQQAEVEDN
jgi:hypothetical protein